MGVLAESLCDLGEEIESLEQQIAQLQTSNASSDKGTATGANEITRTDIEALVSTTDSSSFIIFLCEFFQFHFVCV